MVWRSVPLSAWGPFQELPLPLLWLATNYHTNWVGHCDRLIQIVTVSLGDYAILLQSGFSHSRALLWNFLSATTAILGFLVGYYMSDVESTRQWIFAATIGMFLYIALVDLVRILTWSVQPPRL
jgi:hypothetical protein